MTTDDYTYTDCLTADMLEVGDQIVKDDEYFIIHSIDDDMPNPNEIQVKGENVSGGSDTLTLDVNTYYDLWMVTYNA